MSGNKKTASSRNVGRRRNNRVAFQIDALESRRLLNAGDLDTAFGIGGRVQTTLSGNGLEEFQSAVVQSDGKLVVAGWAEGAYDGGFFGILARYNTNGTLDTTFGSGGEVILTNSVDSQLDSVAIQSDGKIVAGGKIFTGQGQTEFFATRLTSSGALDTTFNSTGVETISFGSGDDGATGIGVQSDGKIVLVGSAGTSFSTSQAALVRLLSTGALDTSFGSGGKDVVPLSTASGAHSSLQSFAFDSSGRIVAAGLVNTPSPHTAVARFTTAGALDGTFVNAGVFTDAVGSGDSPAGIEIQSDGKIVVGGTTGGYFYAVRLTTAGALDSTFGNGTGIYKASTGTNTCVTVGLTSSGAIVLAGGNTASLASSPVNVTRLTSAGVLDTTFNSTGMTSIGTGVTVYGGVVKSTGVVDLVGRFASTYGTSVTQVTSGGALDTTFGSTGQVNANIPVPISSTIQRVALQPDGKTVVASQIDANFDYLSYLAFPPPNPRYYGSVIYLTRYTLSGAIDTTFGSSGIVKIALGTSLSLSGMELLSSGDIVVAGTYLDSAGNSHGELMYFLPSGAPDTAFGANGQLSLTPFAGHTSFGYSALAVASNGDLLLAGDYADSTTTYLATAITPSGTVDTSFGSNGVITLSNSAYYISSDNDGRVLTYGNQGLARYSFSGVVDTSFHYSKAGDSLTPLAGLRGIYMQPDGKILVVGDSASNAPIERFNDDGKLDRTFGQQGVPQLGNPLHYAYSANVLPSGDILIAGISSLAGSSSAYLAELDSNGVLVPTFGASGSVTTGFGEITLVAAIFGDIVVRPNGKIVIAGNEAQNLMVAQFLGTTPDSVTGSTGNDTITLSQDSDHVSIDWAIGNSKGNIPINDSAGLTINGNGGSDTITLVNTNGNPLPNTLHLNGTFTINGLTGSNPLANTNLEIGTSTVYISYANAASDPLATIRGYLKNGYNGGLWTGAPTSTTGVITSSAAAGNANKTTAIGYADSAEGLVTLPANTIELKYTLYGDTGLTGSVGFTDFMRMTQHYTLNSGATWGEGDFNYDGLVGAADFTLLQPNYGQTLPVQTATPTIIAPPIATQPTRTPTIPPPAAPLVDSVRVIPDSNAVTDVTPPKHGKAKHRGKK